VIVLGGLAIVFIDGVLRANEEVLNDIIHPLEILVMIGAVLFGGYHSYECLAKWRSVADHNRCTGVPWNKNCRRWARMAYLGTSGDIRCRVGVAGACSLVGKR
jgi:hypothetical protein